MSTWKIVTSAPRPLTISGENAVETYNGVYIKQDIEKNGYSFLKGEQDSRAFLEADIGVLMRLKELVRDKRETVKKAATIATEEARTPPVHTVITRDQSENTLPVQIEQSTSLFTLNEVRNMIREELDEREKERVKERDQALLTVMKELQEIKRNIAASHEKQRWWKFWKK